MAITPKCDKCGHELTDYGAIILSPPNEQSEVKNCTSVRVATSNLKH